MRRIDSARLATAAGAAQEQGRAGRHLYFVAYFAAGLFELNVQFAYCKALTYADDDNVVANDALHIPAKFVAICNLGRSCRCRSCSLSRSRSCCFSLAVFHFLLRICR